MGRERQPGELIDPQWLIRARKNRQKFIFMVVLVFVIFSVLSWWALPTLVEHTAKVAEQMDPGKKDLDLPFDVDLLLAAAGWFKVFWWAVAIGCAAGILLALTGSIDTLIPLLNFILILAAAAALGMTIYVFYAPARILLESA